MLRDLRYAARLLVSQPLVTTVAVIVLALGIGANTAIFTVINTVLLEPLPFTDADRLTMVWGVGAKEPDGVRPVSVPVFREWQARNTTFERLASSSDGVYSLTGVGDPESIIGYRFDADFFDLLGVAPALGRTFRREETVAGQHRVVVLSHRLWQRRFGANPGVLGTFIALNDEPYVVVGVMPAGFEHPQHVELWTPLVVSAQTSANWDARPLRVAGRLRPGVTIERAQIEMTRIGTEVAALNPASNAAETVQVMSFRDNVAGDIQPTLLMLMAAAAFVLLITCANLANLLLARASARSTEMALRRALGAPSLRLLRQLLVESVMLAVIGSVVGIGLTFAVTDRLAAMFPNNIANLSIPRVEALRVDTRVLGFTILVSVLTGIAFGLAPAFQALRADLRSRTPVPPPRRLRRGLLVAEVALTLVLLAGAGLMLRSFLHVVRSDLGFEPHRVVATQVLLPGGRYADTAKIRAFTQAVVQRLQALPGVESAAATNFLPLSGFWGTTPVLAEGQPPPGPGHEWEADNRVATPDYFRTMGIRLIRGRMFTDRDSATAPAVVIISQGLADRLWPGDDAIGRRITLRNAARLDWWEVVGVSADVKSFGQEEATHLDVYRPFAQAPFLLVAFVVKTAASAPMAAAVRRAIWAVDPGLPPLREDTMEQLAAESTTLRRTALQLLSAFALLALVLAAVGIYGVTAYTVTQRSQEIGVRIALGAGPGSIVKLVVAEVGRTAAAGTLIGLAGALGLMRFASSLLVGVDASDSAVHVLAALVLVAVAMLAAYLPARRAGRVAPMVVLRHQ
jgi:predicted permease